MNRNLIPGLVLITGIIPGPYFYPIFFAVLIYIVANHRDQVDRDIVRSVFPFVISVVSGILFAGSNEFGDILRDFWYYSKILIIALVGFYIGISSNISFGFTTRLTICATILAVVNLGYALIEQDVDGARALAYFSALWAPFVWRHRHSRQNWLRHLNVAFVLLAILMVGLSGSRTGVLTLIVSTMAAYGAYNKITKMAIASLSTVIFAFIVWPLLPQYDAANITVLGKFQNALSEMAFEVGDSKLDMYVNWRGFEAYRAYLTWLNAPAFERIFGLGIGAPINLGQVVMYGDGEVDHLAFIHNAYFTILVKTGVVGLAAILYFLFLPFRISFNPTDPDAVILLQIARGSAIILLIATALIAGPMNKQSMDGVLLIWAWSSGALIRYRRIVGR